MNVPHILDYVTVTGTMPKLLISPRGHAEPFPCVWFLCAFDCLFSFGFRFDFVCAPVAGGSGPFFAPSHTAASIALTTLQMRWRALHKLKISNSIVTQFSSLYKLLIVWT